MSDTWNYRLAAYLLDPHKRRVLLMKSEEQPYAGKLLPFQWPLPTNAPPQQVIQDFFKSTFKVDIEFIFHDTSIPSVLDVDTVQTVAPFFTQVINIGQGTPVIEFVYLAFTKVLFKIEEQYHSWCHVEDLVGKVAPRYVKQTVKHIIHINNK